MLGVLLAVYVAAAALDAAHAAVLYAITGGHECDPAMIAYDRETPRRAAANASIRTLGRIGGDEVILAKVTDPEFCLEQNCQFYAIRLGRMRPRVLLSTSGIEAHDADQAKPLPGLVVLSHGNALITDEVTYRYRHGSYVAVDAARIRGDNHARKPDAVAVNFAVGATSAQLSGKISAGWYDVYAFWARKRQQLVVDGVQSPVKLLLRLSGPYGPNIWYMRDLQQSAPFTLPTTGTYRLQVANDSPSDLPYSLRLSIR